MTDMLRVIMMVPSFPLKREEIKGGVHSAILNLLLGFEKLPVQVRLISLDPTLAKDQVIKWSNNIEVHYCRISRTPVKMMAYLFSGSGILKKHIKAFKPDILHYQIGGTFLLSRIFVPTKIPYLLTIHGISLEEAKVATSLKRKLTYYLNGYLTRLIHPVHIINISNYSRDLLSLKDNANHPVIYNAVAQAYFNVLPKTDNNNQLLYVGVINERKNILFLLKVMSLLKDQGIIYELNVVGGADADDSYYKEVLQFAEKQLAGQVHFRGWVSQSELPHLLSTTDLMVLPSRQETLPMSVAESMAAGRPVLASRVGGLSEMIESGVDGYLFNPDSKDDLVNILTTLNRNSVLISNLSSAARETAMKKFDNALIAAKTISYYKKILKQE